MKAYQGHSQAHHGLQNHSVGDTYPYITIGLGSGLWRVEKHGKVVANNLESAAKADEVATSLKQADTSGV